MVFRDFWAPPISAREMGAEQARFPSRRHTFRCRNDLLTPSPTSLPIPRRHVILRRPSPSSAIPDLRRWTVPIARPVQHVSERHRPDLPRIDRFSRLLRPPDRVFRNLPRRPPPPHVTGQFSLPPC